MRLQSTGMRRGQARAFQRFLAVGRNWRTMQAVMDVRLWSG